MFMALRKKMRAKLLAMTHETPAPSSAMGACSRLEPQPKFSPATTTSPCWTFWTKSGWSLPSMAWPPSSSGSVVTR